MIFARLTWVGFMIVALGWVLLFTAPELAEFLGSATGRSMYLDHFNIPVIAPCTMLTGFGMAIFGALQTGFRALDRFFVSVIERSSKPGSETRTRRPEQPRKIVERGWLKDRAYVLFMDGSVEMETMLGRRLFPSLQDAQEFIT